MLDILDGHPESLDLTDPLAGGLGTGEPGPQLGEDLVAVLHPGPLPLAGRPLVLLPLALRLEPLGRRPGLTSRPPRVVPLEQDLLVVLLVIIIVGLSIGTDDGLVLSEPRVVLGGAGDWVLVAVEILVAEVGLLPLDEHVHHLGMTSEG